MGVLFHFLLGCSLGVSGVCPGGSVGTINDGGICPALVWTVLFVRALYCTRVVQRAWGHSGCWTEHCLQPCLLWRQPASPCCNLGAWSVWVSCCSALASRRESTAMDLKELVCHCRLNLVVWFPCPPILWRLPCTAQTFNYNFYQLHGFCSQVLWQGLSGRGVLCVWLLQACIWKCLRWKAVECDSVRNISLPPVFEQVGFDGWGNDRLTRL